MGEFARLLTVSWLSVLVLAGCAHPVPPYVSTYTGPEAAPVITYPPPPPIVLPPNAKAVFLGDSWTEGYSALPETDGYAYLTEQAMGWTGTVLGANGTGYMTGHEGIGPYVDRITALPPTPADIVILQGSVNDTSKAEAPDFPATVDRTIAAAKAKFTQADIVMFGVCPVTASPTGLDVTLDQKLGAAAERSSVHYISCISHRWINPSNVDDLIDPATEHPSTRGHVYLAQRLTAELRNLLETPS